MICCNLQIHQIYVCTYCLISKNRHAYGKEGNNSWKSAFFLTSNKILSVCKIFYHLFSCVTSFFFLDGNKITYTEYVDTFLFVFYLNTLVCKQKTNVILHGHCCFCTLFTYLIYKSSIVRAVNKYYSK